MSLRINTNVAALNAHNQLASTDAKMSASMAKLSSGFRINSAADDAAGLSVANRLRTNVRSLTVASRNVTEAKAMVNIAEGSANQVEAILERMKELATQSASDNASYDRTKINAEFSTLKTEITRIVGDTEYQGSKLIDGTFGSVATSSDTADFALADIKLSGAGAGTYTLTSSGTTASLTNGTITQVVNFAAGSALNFTALGISLQTDGLDTTATITGNTFTVGGSGGTYQVGSGNVAAEDRIAVSLGNLTVGAAGLNINGIILTSRTDASAALTTLDTAIDAVGTVLGDIGAAVNRMDYTYANLQVTIENFSASESVIRDVDMAAEMTSFTKSQILEQAGVAMLAQANSSSQNILSLFK
jgi:flagellin